jgi:hypothetical protein
VSHVQAIEQQALPDGIGQFPEVPPRLVFVLGGGPVGVGQAADECRRIAVWWVFFLAPCVWWSVG